MKFLGKLLPIHIVSVSRKIWSLGIFLEILLESTIYIYVHAGFNGESDYRFRSDHFHVCSMWWLRVIIRGVLEWPLASYFHIGLLEWITMFYLIDHPSAYSIFVKWGLFLWNGIWSELCFSHTPHSMTYYKPCWVIQAASCGWSTI